MQKRQSDGREMSPIHETEMNDFWIGRAEESRECSNGNVESETTMKFKYDFFIGPTYILEDVRGRWMLKAEAGNAILQPARAQAAIKHRFSSLRILSNPGLLTVSIPE